MCGNSCNSCTRGETAATAVHVGKQLQQLNTCGINCSSCTRVETAVYMGTAATAEHVWNQLQQMYTRRISCNSCTVYTCGCEISCSSYTGEESAVTAVHVRNQLQQLYTCGISCNNCTRVESAATAVHVWLWNQLQQLYR